jgi:hypothetical protein
MRGGGAPDPLLAVRNLAAKAWRRAGVVPKQAIRLKRRTARLQQQAAVFHAEWQIGRELARVAGGRQPIVAGPWLSEVGFEVLYWIPFLRWFEDRYRVDRERLVVVSRGGTAGWYADVAAGYVEIFEHMDPATFARRNAERRERDESGGQKQKTRGALDEELIDLARRHVGRPDATVCHPALMYQLFNQFWLGNRALDLVSSHTRYLPPARSQRCDLGLPERYVAVKFYTGAAIPDARASRDALREIVRTLAARTPVVVLDTGMTTDEHEDYLFHDIPNVMSLAGRMEPRSNLALQTAVIAGAQAFVGTCGSLAWLAPMLGVDTVAVYADDRFLVSHVFFARQMYRQIGAARFDTLDLRAAMQLDLVAPAAQEAGR